MVNLLALLILILSLPCFLLFIILTEAMTRFATRLMQSQARAHYTWPPNSLFNSQRHVSSKPEFHHEYRDKKLSIKEYKAGTGTGTGTGLEVETVQCVFCLSEIVEGEEIRELKCRHLFHRSCLDRWMEYKRATCPICRDSLLPADVEEEEEMELELVWVPFVSRGWWIW